MEANIGILLVALLIAPILISGCLQEPVPDKVMEKYGEIKAGGSGNGFAERLVRCAKGNMTIYVISSDVEVDGPVQYLDEGGDAIAYGGYTGDNGSMAGLPEDFSDYRCEELMVEYA